MKKLGAQFAAGADFVREIGRFGAFAGCLALAAAAAAAPGFDNRQVVKGIAIYPGVLPATSAKAPPTFDTEMHGGTPQWGDQHHVVVALFDAPSGRRITDAEVRAAVASTRLPGKRVSGPQKQLELMPLGGTPSYGNYINMPAPGPYRIDLEVRRPGAPKFVKVSFDYRHAIVATKRAAKPQTLSVPMMQSSDRSSDESRSAPTSG